MDLSSIDLTMLPVVIALVEAVKRVVGFSSRYAPAVSIAAGFAIGFIPGLSIDVLSSLILGLAAAGLYDVGSKTVLGQ